MSVLTFWEILSFDGMTVFIFVFGLWFRRANGMPLPFSGFAILDFVACWFGDNKILILAILDKLQLKIKNG